MVPLGRRLQKSRHKANRKNYINRVPENEFLEELVTTYLCPEKNIENLSERFTGQFATSGLIDGVPYSRRGWT